MKRLCVPCFLAVLAVGLFLPASALADSYEVGALSFDPSTFNLFTGPGEFNIVNLSGTFLSPVTTPLAFTITSLTLDFSTGSSKTLTSSDFSSDWFGGFTSDDSFKTTGNGHLVTEAILTGTVSPSSAKVWDVGSLKLTGLTATLGGSSGPLSLFDTTAVYATTDPVTSTPEPDTLLLLGAGLGVLALVASKAV
jgi:hypothetical protein